MGILVASLDAIGEALVRAVQSVDGFADCTHRGRYNVVSPSLPWAAVSAAGVSSSPGPTLGRYTREVVYDVQLWKAASTSKLDDRVVEAEALMDEVMRRLEEDRTNPASVLYVLPTFVVRSTVLDHLSDPVANNAVFVGLEIELTYNRPKGVSGPAT